MQAMASVIFDPLIIVDQVFNPDFAVDGYCKIWVKDPSLSFKPRFDTRPFIRNFQCKIKNLMVFYFAGE
jgi:hypothetical protein